MKIYRSNRMRFEITLPDKWSEPGFFHRLFRPYDPDNPEFFGPNGAGLKFAIGPISPEPNLDEHQRNLERIAMKYGHRVLEIGSIEVCGKNHATMVYEMPLTRRPPVVMGCPEIIATLELLGPRLRLKNYHLIFHGIEYVITAKVASINQDIFIHEYEDTYDNIVRTFKVINE